MMDIIVDLFVDVHPSKATLTLFLDGNCFVIVSTVCVYSLLQILRKMLADGNTNWVRNALYDCRSLWFDIAFHELWAKTNHHIR